MCTRQPSVGVVIPVKNDWSRAERCIESITKQDYTGRIHITIVDDASNDPPPEWLLVSKEVCLIRGTGGGSYAARNRGLEVTKADIIAFTDADCIPDPGWLSAAVDCCCNTSEDAVIVVGRVVVFVEPGSRITPSATYDIALGLRQKRHFKHGFGATANLVATRSALEIAGPFREDLMSGGDKDWCLRATSRGVLLRYSENAVTYHPARNSMSALQIKTRRLIGGRYMRLPRKLRIPVSVALLFFPPVHALGFALGTHRHGLTTRLIVIGVGFRLWATQVAETFRLIFGRPPHQGA